MKNLEINQLIGRKIDQKNFKQVLNKFLKVIKRKSNNLDISLAIVGDREIKKFNKIYRGKNKVTDVLSFNYGNKGEMSGEIIISYPRAKKQAERYKHAIREEVQLLFAHGLLHLAGFDHKTLKDKLKMCAKEQEILGRGLCER